MLPSYLNQLLIEYIDYSTEVYDQKDLHIGCHTVECGWSFGQSVILPDSLVNLYYNKSRISRVGNYKKIDFFFLL